LVKRQGKIFVVSGPSGSGKTTLVRAILADRFLKKKLVRSVSFTTRPKRSGEKHKRDYYFISETGFKEKRKAKKILEWTRYLGYYYGTAKDFLDKQLYKYRGIVLCLDLKGAAKIKQIYPQNSVAIFIMPSSLEELSARIQKRCSKTKKEEIQKRLKLARREILASRSYDYRLVNKNLKRTIRELKGIIIKNLG
jgi:guanylate kinase